MDWVMKMKWERATRKIYPVKEHWGCIQIQAAAERVVSTPLLCGSRTCVSWSRRARVLRLQDQTCACGASPGADVRVCCISRSRRARVLRLPDPPPGFRDCRRRVPCVLHGMSYSDVWRRARPLPALLLLLRSQIHSLTWKK
ncbi:uncharacterized protein LOC143525930 [Brachyhypopomus gauderio]|uniref:uncharacterized protein LOC143525930 n=1 Tax=Brachyhypopomus gauderio TaxID=698409 RepID=UPI00404136CF